MRCLFQNGVWLFTYVQTILVLRISVKDLCSKCCLCLGWSWRVWKAKLGNGALKLDINALACGLSKVFWPQFHPLFFLGLSQVKYNWSLLMHVCWGWGAQLHLWEPFVSDIIVWQCCQFAGSNPGRAGDRQDWRQKLGVEEFAAYRAASLTNQILFFVSFAVWYKASACVC